MAIFFANKIKANYNNYVKERDTNHLNGGIKNYLSLYKSKSIAKDDHCERVLRPNGTFKYERDFTSTTSKYSLLCRRILTVTPRQMVTISYTPAK